MALLRLVVHCQTPADRSLVVEAWGELPAEPKQILSDEMARTGVAGQRYASRVGANKTAPADFAPALLVYYGPAYLRSSLHDEPVGALHILAEVYRAGRALFPASSDDPAKEDGGVTLHIGQLKAAATAKNIVEAYGKGSCWLLVKTGETEAVVESCAMAELATRLQPPCQAEVLQLWPAAVPLEAHAAGHAEGPGERLPRSSV